MIFAEEDVGENRARPIPDEDLQRLQSRMHKPMPFK